MTIQGLTYVGPRLEYLNKGWIQEWLGGWMDGWTDIQDGKDGGHSEHAKELGIWYRSHS